MQHIGHPQAPDRIRICRGNSYRVPFLVKRNLTRVVYFYNGITGGVDESELLGSRYLRRYEDGVPVCKVIDWRACPGMSEKEVAWRGVA